MFIQEELGFQKMLNIDGNRIPRNKQRVVECQTYKMNMIQLSDIWNGFLHRRNEIKF